ncbi:integrase domain-containing protein [Thiothrix sp.]|jgi:hypothetical protein|uniref:integrase domain-containing protein n=1 Tax=Thiothrix sp. TaxID=1032 RepID=UPI00257EFB4E|nr:integrase domain-containing protein [Thiothrix sp.]
MGLYTSSRNFGFGKSMGFAASNALESRYGGGNYEGSQAGHYNTVAAHKERFDKFIDFAKSEGISDAQKITQDTLDKYAEQVADSGYSIAYAQNLISSVNVVLSALRGNNALKVSPSEAVGQRSHIRTDIPGGIDRAEVKIACDRMAAAGLNRAAAVTGLAREFGMRGKEACIGDLNRWIKEAATQQAINITEGTKGGRGREVDRWVPVTATGLEALHRALDASPSGSRNLLAAGEKYIQFVDGELNRARTHLKAAGIDKYHDLRSAYACERYEQLSGSPAPVLTGSVMTANRDSDWAAREILTNALGHGRIDVVASYIGGRSR